MKIQVIKDYIFSENSEIKVCHNWLSIKDSGFFDEGSQKFELCDHKIKLPKKISQFFNPNKHKVFSVLSIDKYKKKKLECHVVVK